MRRISLFTFLLTATIPVSVSQADGILFKLPEDGTWVQYKMDGQEIEGRRGDKEKYAGTLTISSVGGEKVKGETCRWIEIRHTWQEITRGDTDDRVRILKCLVPEKHVGEGKTPSKHIIRGWRSAFLGSKGKGRPYPLHRSDGSLRLSQPGGMIFGGPLGKPVKLKPKKIKTKLGTFTCTGTRGTFPVKLGNKTTPYTLTVWRSEKVPYGVVRFEMKGNEPDGDIVTFSAIVQEKGTKAETELPKQK